MNRGQPVRLQPPMPELQRNSSGRFSRFSRPKRNSVVRIHAANVVDGSFTRKTSHRSSIRRLSSFFGGMRTGRSSRRLSSAAAERRASTARDKEQMASQSASTSGTRALRWLSSRGLLPGESRQREQTSEQTTTDAQSTSALRRRGSERKSGTIRRRVSLLGRGSKRYDPEPDATYTAVQLEEELENLVNAAEMTLEELSPLPTMMRKDLDFGLSVEAGSAVGEVSPAAFRAIASGEGGTSELDPNQFELWRERCELDGYPNRTAPFSLGPPRTQRHASPSANKSCSRCRYRVASWIMTTKTMKQMELDTENSTSIRADGMPGISDTIQHVLQRCTAVTDVSIRHSTLTNTALNSICQLMRGRLLSLDLHGTKGFTDVGIKALAAYCSQIQTLRLGGGCAVSASGLGESARGWNLT